MQKILAKVSLLVLAATLISSSSALANQTPEEHNILKGNVVETESDINLEPVELQTEQKTDETTELNIQSQDKVKEVNDLALTDKKEAVTTSDRLEKISAFLMTGGLSVSGNVEKSIRDGKAEGRLKDNFLSPIKSAKDGWRADDNMFVINYVGHPLEWFMMANYLKASGASDKEAILISQLTNLTWELVIEGNYVSPSPKDLASNTLGSLAGIYLYNKVLHKPIDNTYGKLAQFGDKHGVELSPKIEYNSQTRGMVFGAQVKVKK